MCLNNLQHIDYDDCNKDDLEQLDLDFDYTDQCNYISEDAKLCHENCDLSILHLNVRGLLGKTSTLSQLLNHRIKGRQLDTIILNETWLTDRTKHMVNIEGYHLETVNRTERKGGGVGFLVSKYLKYKRRPDLEDHNQTTENCFIELHSGKQNILLGSLYRPPNTNDTEFLTYFDNIVSKLESMKLDYVIGLDHNLDLLKAHKHRSTRKFVDIMLNHECLPVITKPTRITKTTATLIDNIIISKRLQKQFDCGIIIDDISDHLPCYLKICDIKPGLKAPEKINYRKINDKAINRINIDLSNHDWSELTTKCANEAFNSFHAILTSSLDEHAPEKVQIVKYRRSYDPWLTVGVRKCMKKQKQLYRASIKSQSENDINKYKNYQKCLSKLKRYCKINYYKQKCLDFKQNSRKLWKLINAATSKMNDKSSIVDCIKNGNLSIFKSTAIVNEMASYFATVGKKFADKIEKPQNPVSYYNDKIPRCKNSIFLRPTNATEINNIINELPNKQSSGHDHVSNCLLKKLVFCLVEPLVIIFNKSLTEGTFPELMKIADVAPLHKGKSKTLVTNYRPISLLLTISKVLEKIMYKRTYEHLNKTDQIYKSQYGFRAKHSCENAISELLGDVIKNRDMGIHTVSVFLDLSKAFDTLQHNVLYEKLERYGIRGLSLEWFKSYLTDRSLRVKCKTSDDGEMTYSELHSVQYGTPQGSCLGPLLFLIFTNDIHLHLQYTSCILFADDTTLYYSHRNLNYAQWCITEDLAILSDWFRANKLTLNLEKTVSMLFSPKPGRSFPLVVNGIKIPQVSETKFLGVWIDERLTWKTHIGKLEGKLKRNLGLLKRSKNLLPISAKRIVYYAHIYSHLTYCILLWGSNLPNATLSKLQNIQNKCVLEIKTGELNSIYKSLRILRVKEIIDLEQKKFGYKFINDLLPIRVKTVVSDDQNKNTLVKKHNYNTRHKKIPNKPKARTKSYQNSFLCTWSNPYMSLSVETKQSTNIKLFTKRCKTDIFATTG